MSTPRRLPHTGMSATGMSVSAAGVPRITTDGRGMLERNVWCERPLTDTHYQV